ncbi:lamin tail domain-containing protein [Patescibacteria group bacterium]|nr:lamin tail domain-containing protein [Patescibacteria group bacterium]
MKSIFRRRFLAATLSGLFLSGEFFVGFGAVRAADSDVKINEVMFAPSDSVEWVELYNGGLASVDLASWSLSDEDGGAEYTFPAALELPRDSYLVIRSDEGTDDNDFSDGQGVIYANHGSDYANSGDQVALYDGASQIVDFVAWGSPAGIDIAAAAEVDLWTEDDYVDTDDLKAGESIGLVADGQDNDTSADWRIFSPATPGETNVNAIIEYSDQIRLNEILPNPATDESTKEFIELYNAGDVAVDLAGWILGDASTTTYTIAGTDFDLTTVAAGGYFTIYRAQSRLALNNSGDSVKLYQPDQNLLNSVTYVESAKDDVSYNFAANSWQWSTKLTPGAANQVETPNNVPRAEAGSNQSVKVGEKVTLDGTDSSDPDDDQLTCVWDFGDDGQGNGCTITHAYTKAGSYTAKLTVSDGRGSSDSDTVKITVSTNKDSEENDDGKDDDSDSDSDDSSDDSTETKEPTGPFSWEVIVTEFLPNPAGSDTDDKGEFVEIHNKGATTVDLASWQLDDEEGGSSPHTIPDDTVIKPGEYLAFYRGETKLSINNSGDSVRILHPDGKVADSVTYEGKAEENQAYARDEQSEWTWTTSPTPGKANQINQSENEDKDDSDTSTDSTESDTPSKDSTPTQTTDKDKESTEAEILTIKQAKTQAKNTKVVVAGVVTVPPKILGDTYIYIQDKTGGIQIYFSKKDFPDLKLGNQVKVSGKVSESSGEKKINIAEQKDVLVTGLGDLPSPAFLSTGGVKEQFVGQLIKVTGQLTKSSGTTFYINDGSGEIKISLQKSANLKKPEWKKEDWVTITGVVGKTSAGLRVLPRYQEDLQTGKAATGEEGKIPAVGAGILSGLLLSIFLVIASVASKSNVLTFNFYQYLHQLNESAWSFLFLTIWLL